MQYTKNDWRNRNKIKTQAGTQWLTIPVKQITLSQKINETKIADKRWKETHLKTIKQFYSKASCFKELFPFIESLYKTCESESLSEINYHFISSVCSFLQIKTKITWSHDYGLIQGKTERLVDLVLKAGGNEYISGPAAKEYIVSELFEEANIKLTWMDYSGYAEYPQLHRPFEHGVSIIDLILNTGPEARSFMKSFNKNE
jgi:hypothetical protein